MLTLGQKICTKLGTEPGGHSEEEHSRKNKVAEVGQCLVCENTEKPSVAAVR